MIDSLRQQIALQEEKLANCQCVCKRQGTLNTCTWPELMLFAVCILDVVAADELCHKLANLFAEQNEIR